MKKELKEEEKKGKEETKPTRIVKRKKEEKRYVINPDHEMMSQGFVDRDLKSKKVYSQFF
jgi:hypothetical protein